MTEGKWLVTVLRPLAPAFRRVLAVSFFVNCLGLAVPVFVLQVYDRVIYHAGMTTLQGLALGMVAVLAFDYLLRQFRTRLTQSLALKIDVDAAGALVRKIATLPLRALEARPTVFWQAVFRDVETIRNTVAGPTALLVADLPFVAVFVVAIFVVAPPLGWVFTGIAGVMICLSWYAGRALEKAGAEERIQAARRDVLLGEMLAARGSVKALDLSAALAPLWEDRHAGAVEAALLRGRRNDRFVNLGLVLGMASSVVLTTVGAVEIVGQQLSVGALVAANILASRLFAPLNQLLGAWRQITAFRQATSRLNDLMAEPEDISEQAVELAPPAGRLEAERVAFRFAPNDAPAIEGVSLTISPGGVTGILGRNGGGKTTLVKLLLGLYRPESGRVLLDGADVGQFTRGQLAAWIGYLPQETVLFSGTLRDNIAWGNPGCTDDEVIEAAERAGAHGFILDLPAGYGTVIGEGGTNLSPGMRQRIALARALAGAPPVVVLDEPSSWLDRQAEEALRAALVSYAKEGRTVVVVTHSPLLLAACRDVVVIDKGRIAAAGPAPTVLPNLFAGTPAPQREVMA